VHDQPMDAVVLATACAEAARLVQHASLPAAHTAAAQHWGATATALPHTAIATVYAHTQQPLQQGKLLPAPMVALRNTPQAPAQFAFDKAQLDGPAGVIALVISACHTDKATLQA